MAGISLTLNYGPDDPRRAPYQAYVEAMRAYDAVKMEYWLTQRDPKTSPQWQAVVQTQAAYVEAQNTYQRNIDAGNVVTPSGVWPAETGPVTADNPAPGQAATETPAATPAATPVDDGIDEDAAALLERMFAQYGISGLGPVIRQWLQQGYSADTIALLIRDTPQYKERFPAMEALAQRGMAISEATYIEQERAYRQVMVSYGLPEGFYDQPEDFAGFMVNDVSPNELDERVYGAKRILDASDPAYRDALREFYGISDGVALAHILDPKKAQDFVRQQIRTVEIGGAAGAYGFDLSLADASRYAGSAFGQAVDPFSPGALAAFEQQMGNARVWATADSAMARVENTRYNERDAIDVQFGDRTKELESRRRAQRETGRFSGSSGVGRTSLGARSAQG